MNNKILVITATLGNRDSLRRTINSVASIGKDDVKHIVVAPPNKCESISNMFNITCIPEPEGKKGIYAALNYGFQNYANEYKYMTFINDDDFWVPEFRVLIDTILQDKYDLVYGKTKYFDEKGKVITEQSCSGRFKDFVPLLRAGVVMLTQQATIIKSKWYFKLNGFDESYKLVADSKFWALLSLENINYKYFNKCCAGYTIQEGQLSSDHGTQRIEGKRMLSELPRNNKFNSTIAKIRFRLSNIKMYLSRFLNIGTVKSNISVRWK